MATFADALGNAWARPGLAEMMTNLGFGLMTAGQGGGPLGQSRLAAAAPYLSAAVAAPRQAQQQQLAYMLANQQAQMQQAQMQRQQSQDAGRTDLANMLVAPDMMPMSDMEGGGANPYAQIPQAQRAALAAGLRSGMENPAAIAAAITPKTPDPIFQDMPVGEDRIQKSVSYDGGRTFKPFGEAQPRWQPKGEEGKNPLTDAGRAYADFQRGLIDKPTYDAIVASAGFNARTQVGDIERKWRNELQAPMNSAADLAKQTNIIETALNKKDGTGDIAAIVAFNKMLDEGAVVREADVALTLQAQGVADRLQIWAQNKKEGDILPQELRNKMAALTKDIKESSSELLRDRIMSRKDAVEREGGKFDAVVPKELVSRFGWDKPRKEKEQAKPVSDVNPYRITAPQSNLPPLPDGFVLNGGG